MEGRRQGAAVSAAYRDRLAERQHRVRHCERLHARISWVRLGLLGLALAIVAALGRESPPWLVVPLVLFIPLAFYHGRVLNRRDRAVRAVSFYERGLARLENRWQGTGASGERYRRPEHPYADDLDLFGPGGVFELLATTRTTGGESVLASWLLEPSAPDAVRVRQQAIEELAPRLDLREDLAVLGPELQAAVRTDELAAWATSPSLLTAAWPRIAAPILAAPTVWWLIDWVRTSTPSPWLLVTLIVQGLFALIFRKRVHAVEHAIERRDRELTVLAELMARIERDPVASPLLERLRADLHATGRSPADEIRGVARIADFLTSSHNPMFAIIAAALLLRTQLAFALERWRQRCGPAVPRWLAAVAEYEALSAMATYRAEHPDDPLPEIVEGEPLFEGEGLAHPLLPLEVAIRNDLRLGHGHPHLLVVSGSNMSGKSTLLRTVGTNAVLALAGAPVRATRLRLTPLRVGATLRINDSLQEGRSRFYAEITRLAAIVRLAREEKGVLFLCDELLSGTNSHDRLQGATGILKGLLGFGAIGLVTTHDLALTAMAGDIGQRAANVHFEDRFENDVLTFDYRLREGVVRTGNAIPLMRSVGLDV